MNWGYLIISYLSLFCVGLFDNARGPAYPKILELFNLSNSEGSLIFALTSGAGIVFYSTSRHWLGYLGPLRALRISMLVIFLGQVIFALSGMYANKILLYSGIIIIGLGLGINSTSMNVLVAHAAPRSLRRKAFTGFHAVYGLASLSSPLLINLFYHLNFKWYQFFLLLSFLPLFVYFGSSNLNRINDFKQKKLIAPQTRLIRYLFSGTLAIYAAGEILLFSRLVLYLTEVKGFTNSLANNYLSLFFALMLAGRLIATFLNFKKNINFYLYVSLISSIILVVLGLNFFPILLSVSGLTVSIFFPSGMEWLSEHFKSANDIEFITASLVTNLSITLMIIHFAFGVFTEYLGINITMFLSPLLMTTALLMLFTLNCKFKTQRQ